MPAKEIPASSRYAAALTLRMAALSVGVALFLVALKGWAYQASASVSMLATLVDSALDVAASLLTLLAVRYAATPPDRDHRFGHGKAEAFAGLMQVALVAVSALVVIVEAVRRWRAPAPPEAAGEGVGVLIISLLVTAGLIWLQSRAIATTGSIATKGDRAHYVSDLAANLAAILGIAGAALLRAPWIDALAGGAIALWLLWGAQGIAREAADHLLDHELPEADRARIRELVLADPSIRDVHDLRTRASGVYLHVQFHATLDAALTLEAAHAILVAAEARIRKRYPNADVIIHPDPKGRAAPHGHEDFARAGDGATG